MVRAGDMAQLLAGILRAVVEADTQAREAFLEELGRYFTETEEGMEPIYLTLRYSTQYVDDEGRLQRRREKVEIPLLTLVNPSHIGVEKAEIELYMDVVSTREEQGVQRLFTVFRGSTGTRSESGMRIRVLMTRSDVGEGLANVISTLVNKGVVVE